MRTIHLKNNANAFHFVDTCLYLILVADKQVPWNSSRRNGRITHPGTVTWLHKYETNRTHIIHILFTIHS